MYRFTQHIYLPHNVISLYIQPQVIWRGTDFGYLHSLIRPRLHSPIGNYLEELIKECTQSLKKKPKMAKAAATQALRKMYDQLSPRWKGAVLTAVSYEELHACLFIKRIQAYNFIIVPQYIYSHITGS